MEATGAIGDYTHLWWDVRPHPRFGTLELRVMDCQTRVEDAIALAAYVQCLVKLLLDRYLDGRRCSRTTACCWPRTSGSPCATAWTRR